MLAFTLASTIYSRTMFARNGTGTNRPTAILPQNISPDPFEGKPDPTYGRYYNTDSPLRRYTSSVHYDPVSWNCQLANFQYGMSSPMDSRCSEGLAVFQLMTVLVILQVAMLSLHVWDWVVERKGEVYQNKLGSEEELVTMSCERSTDQKGKDLRLSQQTWHIFGRDSI